MKNLAAGASFVLLLVLANAVAAGTLMVLGHAFAEPIEDDVGRNLALGACGIVAIAAALMFLRGCLTTLTERLQCQPARRGGKGARRGTD